jgi:hypothetical protein
MPNRTKEVAGRHVVGPEGLERKSFAGSSFWDVTTSNFKYLSQFDGCHCANHVLQMPQKTIPMESVHSIRPN